MLHAPLECLAVYQRTLPSGGLFVTIRRYRFFFEAKEESLTNLPGCADTELLPLFCRLFVQQGVFLVQNFGIRKDAAVCF